MRQSEKIKEKQPKHTGWITVSHNAMQFLWKLVSSSGLEKIATFYLTVWDINSQENKSKLWDKKNHNCEKKLWEKR